MDLVRKEQSLKAVFIKYFLSVAVGLIFALCLGLMIFNLIFSSGLILPANYAENILQKNQKEISNGAKFDESLIPDNAKYIYLSTDGKTIKTDMSKNLKQKAVDFHNREGSSTPYKAFMEFKRADGYVIVNYSIEPHYRNPWMEKHFPRINILFAIFMTLLCIVTILIITIVWAKRLTKQLTPMLEASEEIAKQQLDFEIGKSNIKEFNEVLQGLEHMKVALSASLRENWIQEENKRKQISALTHDLKTPISILQGNAELLKDTELTEEQNTYVDFIIKNSNRISDYSKALMTMNGTNQLEQIDCQRINVSVVAEKARELAKEITTVNKRILSESLDIKNGFVALDLDLFVRALQNILSNAVEYSPEKSVIKLDISSTDSYFEISVTDQGKGFSNEDLKHGTEEFYRGDKSRGSSSNYGLGLYSAKKIIEMHNGSLLLSNREDGLGATVKIRLPLYSATLF